MDERFRLDKLLSMAGMTRSEARRAIASGRAQVAGQVVRDAAARVAIAEVRLDGRPLEVEVDLYLMVNKPAGVVTATEDARFPTVVGLLPERLRRRGLGPVGRLDRDVGGLVLLTTDGVLAHRLISPRWKAEKVYFARCEGRLDDGDVRAFAEGVPLGDFVAKPARLEIVEASDSGSAARAALTEGKFHQVKRMFAAVGHPLESLFRERIGCVSLDPGLAPGEYRPLTPKEVEGLRALVGLSGE